VFHAVEGERIGFDGDPFGESRWIFVDHRCGFGMERTAWYETRYGMWSYWGAVCLTLLVVGISVSIPDVTVPSFVYVFGFLGAMVYVFTSFAKRFDHDDRYVLKVLSRTVAVLPLAAGVYLLAGAFPVTETQGAATGSGGEGVPAGSRLVAGLVFLAGIYVSITLQALGELAERLLGVSSARDASAGDARGDVDSGFGEDDSAATDRGESAATGRGDSDVPDSGGASAQ
jgi:hypothetical protein